MQLERRNQTLLCATTLASSAAKRPLLMIMSPAENLPLSGWSTRYCLKGEVDLIDESKMNQRRDQNKQAVGEVKIT
jgi:hypothetical protein